MLMKQTCIPSKQIEKTTMQAATLQKKKNTLSKGKLKKTIKNVLCRPDPVFWPTISEMQQNEIEAALSKYKVQIPDFKKLHWDQLKLLPKDKRPKPPKIEKVEGLMFGLSQCCESINRKECSGIIIESTVNPRAIVQPTLEACVNAKVPAVCLNGLRRFCENNFGIPTSCLGIKTSYLTDISEKINKLSYEKFPHEKIEFKTGDVEMAEDVKHEIPITKTKDCPYLYRTTKKLRIFVPPLEGHTSKANEKFVGQDFIEFSVNKPANSKAFKKMMVKRITNNPNRTKVK